MILLVQQMVTGTVGTVGRDDLEEGSGLEESSDIINNVRGDSIEPEDSDYEYSDFIPIHNDFLDHYDSDSTVDEDEGLCDHPNCWTTCGGAEAENNMVCSCCPAKRPVKEADIDLSLTCSPKEGVVGYNLSRVREFGLEDMSVVLSYTVTGEDEVIGSYEVEDLSDVEFSWPGLCSGLEYLFCVEVMHSNMSKLDRPLCQVSQRCDVIYQG